MDEVEGCSSHDQQEDTSSASQANRPVRRLRLAQRRQYARSRRLASSALRSQFVHYDALSSYYHDSDDSSRNQPDTVQNDTQTGPRLTLEQLGYGTTNQDEYDRASATPTRNNAHSVEHYHHNHHQQQQQQQQHLKQLPPRSPGVVNDVNHLHTLKSPPIIFPRQRNSKPEISASAIKLTGEHHSSSMPSPRCRTDTSAELEIKFMGDYSSSSLDSCSLADSNWDNSNRILHSPLVTPSAAQSLNHLPNHCGTSATSTVAYQQDPHTIHQTKQFIRASDSNFSGSNLRLEQLHQGQDRPEILAERVVRSETVDLDRIRLSQQQSESPRSKFFSGPETFRAWTSSEQQASANYRPQLSPRVISSKGGRGSGHNLSPVYRSVDQILPLKDRRRGKSEDCIDNVHFNDLFHGTVTDSSSVTVNQSVRTDPRLYKDDVDIKFSRALNSCKLPQIRYASKERLFERLTDLRFLSIDFLNTFLLTYRVFTTAKDVLEALKSVHYNIDRYFQQGQQPNIQQRESFSAFANSSLVSLNTDNSGNNNTGNTNSTPNAGAHNNSNNTDDNVVYEPARPIVSNKSTNLSETGLINQSSGHKTNGDKINKESSTKQITPLTIRNQHQQTRPSVPPRSPGADQNIQARLHSHIEDAFLLTPNAHQHQKRRSTISALTPITGSNSSSLANLTQTYNLAGNQSASSDTKLLSSCSNSPNTHSYVSDADDAGLEFSESEIKSPVPPERGRSSSTSSRPISSAADAKGSINLVVPGVRQTRAASLSITPSGNLLNQTNVTGEHWRLSYKKTQADAQPSTGERYLNTLRSEINSPANRRASSADINVTLQVTPAQQSEDSTAKVSDEEALSDSRSYQPGVPPSTPIEPVANEEDEIEPILGNSLSNSKVKQKESTGQESSATGKLGDEMHPDNKQSSMQKGCKISTTSSSSLASMSTSSSSTSLVMTSQSESGLIQSTSSLDDASHSKKKESKAKHRESVRRKKKLNPPRSKGGSIKILKEIELTQAKIMDCDTSADEDKVSTSSGDYTDQQVNDSDESDVDTKTKQPKSVSKAIGGEQSIRIPASANSVKVDEGDGESRVHGLGNKIKNVTLSPAIETGDSSALQQDKDKIQDSEHTAPSQVIQLEPTSPTKSRASPIPSPSRASQITPSRTPDQAKSIAGQSAGLQSIPTSSRMTTPRSSFQHHPSDSPLAGERISKAGVVVTASAPRVSSRRSSTASAASAFAAATAASNNPILTQPPLAMRNQNISTAQSRSSNELAAKQTYDLVGQLESGPCSCSAIRRGSCTTSQAHQSQQKPYPKFVTGLDQQQSTRPIAHHPSCIYFQQVIPTGTSPQMPSNYYPNPHSDASSLCNSRASSRLSSCAGLESSTHSSAQVNFYAQQQQQASKSQGSSQNQSLRGSNAGLIGRVYPANSRSKRNSTQINIRSVATIRVLSVLRHWVSKHSQDFVNDAKLSYLVQEFLQDLIMDSNLLPAEHKAALQLQQMVQKAAHSRGNQVDLDVLLAPPAKPSLDSIETLSALEIAEGMTYLDHKIFLAIRSEEFLGQAWMKVDKAIKAPHILLITKRFNDVSRLVSSEIIRVPELHRRVAIIEKWTNVAHICRVVHNFNGVLQICAAFTNSAVFRLKKTWDKIPKTTKTTIDQLQNLVSTDSRFRNMRDAISRCDPPSIPYVGMYLTDLSFIEEGTPNYSPEGLLNFSKMRMIAHVIREIQHLQNGSYKIELNSRVANYLLDSSRHLQDDEMYRCSLAIEPRSSGGKNGAQILTSVSTNQINGPVSQQQGSNQKSGSNFGTASNS